VSSSSDFGVKIEDFVELISGMLSPPCGRLIFFTTNHCNRLHEEILRVVDEQGVRVEFPNADLSIMKGMWRQFYKGVGGSMRSWEAFERGFLALYGGSDMVSIIAERGKAAFEVLVSTVEPPLCLSSSSPLSSSSSSSSSSLHGRIRISTRRLADDMKANCSSSPSSSSSSSSSCSSSGNGGVGGTKREEGGFEKRRAPRNLSLRVSLAPQAKMGKAKKGKTLMGRRQSSADDAAGSSDAAPNAKRAFEEGLPFAAQLVEEDSGDVKDAGAEATSSMEIPNSGYLTAREALLTKTSLDNVYSFVLPAGSSAGNKRCLRVDEAGGVSAADMESLPAKERHLATFQARFCTRFSAAAMQEHMMRFRNSPEEAAKNVHMMLQK